MANLGSDDTPIAGESFGLPSGWSLTENAAGEVVIEDSGSNVVFRRDETAGEWVTDSIDAQSATVEEATIDGLAPARAIDTAATVSRHSGDLVELTDDETQEIFDVQDPTTILYGRITGSSVGEVEAITPDGTIEIYDESRNRGRDQDGAWMTPTPLPYVEDVETLQFTQRTSGSNEYGWEVVTLD